MTIAKRFAGNVKNPRRGGGRPKGLPRTGGKKKGTPDKINQKIRARALRDEHLTIESTIEAMRRGSQYDIRCLLDEHGNFKALNQLTEEQAWCIASAEIIVKNAVAGDGHQDTVLKIKFVDRAKYVELAARHLGMLHDKVDIDVNITNVGAKLDAARLAARQRNMLTDGSLEVQPLEVIDI